MAEIKYNVEAKLSAPEGVEAVFVKIEIDPPDASVLVYGYDANGDIQPVQINGSAERIDLPFSQPQIYVRYLKGAKAVTIYTLGWRDPRNAPPGADSQLH